MDDNSDQDPTVGEEALIDERAKRTFPTLLPLPWRIRPQTPDYAIDYLVELVESGEHTGIQFGVQLKGRKKKNEEEPFTRDLKTKHIRYWLNDYRLPVFVVLVDFDTEEVRWLFAQEWAKGLPKEKLENQKTIRVQFPAENQLRDENRLTSAVNAALSFMEDLHPGSIKAALAKQKAEIEKIDPRLSASIDLIGGVPHVYLKPASNCPVTFNIQVKSKDGFKKAKDFIEAGDDLSLDAGEFEISGLPHFAKPEPGLKHRLQFIPSDVREAEVLLVLPNNLDPVILKGELRHGQKFLQFKTHSTDHPLSSSLKIALCSGPELPGAESTLKLDLAKWNGKPLTALPFLEDVLNLASACSVAGDLGFRLRLDGHTLLRGRKHGGDMPYWKSVERVVATLKKSSDLCLHFKRNIPFPGLEHLSDQMLQDIDEAHSLVFTGKSAKPIPNQEFSLVLSSITQDYPESTVGHLRLGTEFSMSLFGHDLFKRPIFVYKYSQRLVSKTPVDRGIEFRFRGEENAEERVTFAD